MRIAMLAFFLSSCASVAQIVKPGQATTLEEYCIQVEMQCLNESYAGGVAGFFIVFMHRETSGEEVVRACELQGKLCRERKGIVRASAATGFSAPSSAPAR